MGATRVWSGQDCANLANRGLATRRALKGASLPFLLALLALSSPALAIDPSARWHTIETPNFRVHFHEGPHMYELGQRTARVCEAAHALLAPRLRWQPGRKTDVIVSDDQDSANGSAFTLYRPWMRIYAEVPDDQSVLNDYEDYLWNLVVHEYTHVLHLDTVTGVPEAVDRVFGKLLIPNAYAPRWLTEGLATWEESNLSQSGRLRSSLFDMYLRASFAEGPFGLDDIAHSPQAWPRGNLAYLYGGHFFSFVADEVGEEALPDYLQLYGGRLIPYTLNDSAHLAWNRDFVSLYARWLDKTHERFAAQLAPVRAVGLTPLTVLTRTGYGTEQPQFTSDGARIVYLEAGPDRRPGLRAMRPDGSEDTLIRELWSSGAFDLSPDDRRAVISLTDIYEQYQVYEDLYEIDLATGALARLSDGLRATEPRYAQDGARIAFVGRAGGGHTYLGLFDRSKRTVERLVEAGPDERLFTPIFSPDGSTVVATQQSGAGRRLIAVDVTTRAQEVWLEAPWLILQPRFASDGAVYFTADRTGIYNLHRFDPKSGELRQFTNVETGVFHPSFSPDGAQVALVRYSANGYDIAVMNAADAFEGALQTRPERGPRIYVDDPVEVMPVRAYRPTATLLPNWWLPTVGADPRGPTFGFITGGGDILERHGYSLQASFGASSLQPAAFASYSNRTFHPGFDVYATTHLAQMTGFPPGYYDRQWAAGAQMSVPHATFERSVAVTFAYELRYFDPRFSLPLEPDAPVPLLPRRGTAGTASLGFSFSNARGYAGSISAEEGFSFSATARHSSRYTFGTFSFSSIDGRVQKYLAAPWALHHAFALQISAGTALGDLGERGVFSLGGIGISDPFLQLVQGQRAGSGALRGYPSGAFGGNSFALGTLEYRLPLLLVDRGVDTLPFYLRRIHGALFAEVGAVGRRELELTAPRPSAGAEVRSDLTLGYVLPAQLRLGYGYGFAEEGIHNVYLTLGSSF